MNVVVLASVAIHVLSLGACLLLLRRFRDWRIGGLTALISLLALGQTVDLTGAGPIWPITYSIHASALFGLLVSILGFLSVLHLRAMSIEQESALGRVLAGERRYRDLFEGAVEGIYRTDPEGRFIEANPALARMYGYQESKDLLGLSAEQARATFVEPEAAEKMVRQTMENGAISGSEHQAYRRDGAICWLSVSARALSDADGRYLGLEGFVQDITRRKEAEAALRQSEARLRSLIEIIPANIYLKDIEGRYLAINRTCEQLWGVTDAEVRGKLPGEVHDQAAFAEQARADDLIVLDSGEAIEREQEVCMADGSHTLRVIKFPVRDTEGMLAGVGAIATDVTPQKSAERAVKQAEEEVEHANHAKAEFLATMSHELRTPLTSIIGFSELIKGETFGAHSDPRYGDFAGDIFDAGHHLLELINDILDLSKIEARGSELLEEEIDIADLLGSVQRMLAERAEREGLSLEIVWQGELPNLRGDRRKLKQVLINLLTNAIKFTEAGGQVRLRTWYRKESGYVFQVIDTGIGIPLAEIPKALAQFGQVESHLSRRREGTGLGLPLSKALIELHGGSFDLQSRVGIGTTVTFRIPAERILAEADASEQLLA